jgi:predicted extracellular nuclease
VRYRVFALLAVPLLVVPLLPPGAARAADTTPLTVGAVQGPTTDAENPRTDRSPLANPSGNGTSATLYEVRGVVTQRTLARTATGASQNGFFLQSRAGADDGDPTSSDGIFVFMGANTSLIGGYVPTVGDEIVVRARVSEYYSMTQLSSASLVTTLATGLDVDTDVVVDNAVPPADLAAAERFWERHEGARLRVRAGAGAVSGRNVFAATADAEVFVIDRADPLLARTDPFARRTFRDPHPLDNDPARFDDGNGGRILLGSMGVKATAADDTAMLPPARTFDTLTGDAVGGLYYSFNKYGLQPQTAAFAPGADPSTNHPPVAAARSTQFAVSTYNVENLYDFRDDPFDGCDFLGNTGCPGVSPPFDYVPASKAQYDAQLGSLADQVIENLHGPDLVLVQEAEDQDICTVTGDALSCGVTNNADGQPDTLQELALTIAAAGGPAYAAAYDRTGADDRGITAAFLYRTDRLSLAAASASDPVLGANPAVAYRSAGLASNADVSNPKALNAVLPSDVDRSTGVDGRNVFTRAPQVAKFVVASAPGAKEHLTLWAVSNHYSSGPDTRVGQRREQAAYGAAIVTAIGAADGAARIAYGGDLNVFPRPDDPVPANPGDQLAPLYAAGLHDLWDDLVVDAPSSAYSYVFDGQAQTLDHLFVNDALHGDLIEMRAAHINADWAADDTGNGSKGSSDHDPQVARFQSRAALSVADATVVEGDRGTTTLNFPVTLSRPLSRPMTVCATTVGVTAWPGSDFDPLFGCRTIPAGASTTTFAVTVHGDVRREPDETFVLLIAGLADVRLTDAAAFGTITDDD